MSISSSVETGPIRCGSKCTFLMGGCASAAGSSASRFDMLALGPRGRRSQRRGAATKSDEPEPEPVPDRRTSAATAASASSAAAAAATPLTTPQGGHSRQIDTRERDLDDAHRPPSVSFCVPTRNFVAFLFVYVSRM